ATRAPPVPGTRRSRAPAPRRPSRRCRPPRSATPRQRTSRVVARISAAVVDRRGRASTAGRPTIAPAPAATGRGTSPPPTPADRPSSGDRGHGGGEPAQRPLSATFEERDHVRLERARPPLVEGGVRAVVAVETVEVLGEGDRGLEA